MIPLMIALGAAVGAPARYLTDRAVQSRHETVLPWGT
ncbi:MAG TPA: fluoride efflux transporter CrcB, partial [Chloroflexi bacterium]|nr:fluoride efflux transporter CrcB [Chloroflexota bacterium]